MSEEARILFGKTRLMALSLPAEEKRDTYHDTKTPGLQLRVTSSGTKTFSVYRRLKSGEPVRETLGRFPAMTVEQARKAAAAVIAKIEEGCDPTEVKRAIRKEETFEELFTDFIKNRRSKTGKPLSPKTITGYQSDWRNHLAKLGKKKISQVSENDLSTLYNKIGQNHPTAANRVRALASSLFSHAIDTKRTKANPVNGVRKRFAENEINRHLSSEEVARFFAAMDQLPTSWKMLFTVSVVTGIRRENVLGMRWPDVDMDCSVWWLKRTKGDKPQAVPLPTALVGLLQGWREECASREWVFPSSGAASGHTVEPKKRWAEIFNRDELHQIIQRITESGANFEQRPLEPLGRTLKRAKAEAEKLGLDLTGSRMDHARLHDLRHTAASWMLNNGAALISVGKSLNHSSIQSTMRYAHLELDVVRRDKERTTNAMLGAAGLLPSAEVIPLKKAS